MGLLRRLLGTQRDGSEADATAAIKAVREEELRVNVVGESHYQEAIEAACGSIGGEDVLFDCMAELVPEPDNPRDRNAVRVDIEGRCVGHLSRNDAAELGPFISAAIQGQGSGMCRAVIAGHADGETTNLGVFLHLDISREI